MLNNYVIQNAPKKSSPTLKTCYNFRNVCCGDEILKYGKKAAILENQAMQLFFRRAVKILCEISQLSDVADFATL